MTSFTANRGYPYSDPTDPADVPSALQSFAEAVDDDLETRDVVIGARPYAKIRGATTTPVAAGAPQVQLPFEIEDFDTDDMVDLTVSRTSITIRTAGFYWLHARLRLYSNGTPPANPFAIVAININGLNLSSVGRYHHNASNPSYSDGTLGAGKSLVVGDVITLGLAHNWPNHTNISRYRELAAFRVAT